MILDPELGMSGVSPENSKLIWMWVHELPDTVSKKRERVCVQRGIFLERDSVALIRFSKGVHELNHEGGGTEDSHVRWLMMGTKNHRMLVNCTLSYAIKTTLTVPLFVF